MFFRLLAFCSSSILFLVSFPAFAYTYREYKPFPFQSRLYIPGYPPGQALLTSSVSLPGEVIDPSLAVFPNLETTTLSQIQDYVQLIFDREYTSKNYYYQACGAEISLSVTLEVYPAHKIDHPNRADWNEGATVQTTIDYYSSNAPGTNPSGEVYPNEPTKLISSHYSSFDNPVTSPTDPSVRSSPHNLASEYSAVVTAGRELFADLMSLPNRVGFYSTSYRLIIPNYAFYGLGCKTFPEIKEITCPNLGGISLPFIHGTYRCPQSN